MTIRTPLKSDNPTKSTLTSIKNVLIYNLVIFSPDNLTWTLLPGHTVQNGTRNGDNHSLSTGYACNYTKQFIKVAWDSILFTAYSKFVYYLHNLAAIQLNEKVHRPWKGIGQIKKGVYYSDVTRWKPWSLSKGKKILINSP